MALGSIWFTGDPLYRLPGVHDPRPEPHPDFALPYWDWTADPGLPVQFANINTVLNPASAAYIASSPAFNTAFAVPIQTMYTHFNQAQLAQLNTRGLPDATAFAQQVMSDFFAGPASRNLNFGAGFLSVPVNRKQSSDESIVLRLKIAPLQDGATIEVFALDNTLIGGVAPFGVRPGSKARYYSIPIPAKAVVKNRVTVRVEVVENSGKRKRPATRSEIEGATLAYTPIVHHPGDKKP